MLASKTYVKFSFFHRVTIFEPKCVTAPKPLEPLMGTPWTRTRESSSRRKHEFHMEVVRTHHSREVIESDFDRYMAVIDRYMTVTNLHDRYNRYTPECPQALGLPAFWEGVKR